MANRCMKRCSTSLITREMQIKAPMKYRLTPARTAIIKTSTNNNFWRECEEKGAIVLCWWKYKFVQPLWRFLRKLKIELPYDPSFPLLGIYLEKNENTNLKRYMLPSVHSSTIYNTQDMEATHIPINR